MVFTRQLATLIDAGFPLLNGLAILGRQEKDPVFRKVLSSISDSIRRGETFSESLKRHPAIFSNFFIHMVHAGEVGGIMVFAFLRLAEFQEKAHKLRNKVVAAIAYPLLVIVTAVAILCFLTEVIIPKFQSLLPEILGDKPMPPLTNFVANAGGLFRENSLGILGGFLVCFIVFRWIPYVPKGKYLLDDWKLKLPFLGDLIRRHAISSFSRTLGTLITSGVPILQALMLTRETMGNLKFAAAIDQIYNSVQSGESISHPLAASNVFPPMAISMIHVGEETGQLSQMLLKIADIYEDEVETALAGLTSLIEPTIIIFLAFLVGTIVIALFLPLMSIANDFSTP